MLRRLRPYMQHAAEAGERHGVDPFLILAVMDRESGCGLFLRPVGPQGTGDWVPRRWARYQHGTLKLRRFIEDGVELCMPEDGHGWGRSLMQLDYASPRFQAFLAKVLDDGTPAWQDARENIHAGAEYLSELIRIFDGNEGLAASAYNGGPDAVGHAINGMTLPVHGDRLQRAADAVTTGRNYGGDVLTRRGLFRKEFETEKLLRPKE